MKTKPIDTEVTVKFTLRFTRKMTLTQHDKPAIYSNVEWAEQQLLNACLETEWAAEGEGKECTYDFIQGHLPDEICEDDEGATP